MEQIYVVLCEGAIVFKGVLEQGDGPLWAENKRPQEWEVLAHPHPPLLAFLSDSFLLFLPSLAFHYFPVSF